jgi:2-polyprenyl-3-methyl-5-hydroxy-6-metoxy-1,4-benzoquinol methylase
MICRHCHNRLKHIFLDLGAAPPSNSYLREVDLNKPEIYYPLKLKVCQDCWLVQTQDYAMPEELFSKDYAYFSSTSTSWLNHARYYCSMIAERLELNENSFIIEIACNDGYLLKNFVSAGIPCLGIEPATGTAVVAEKLGVPVMHEYFSERTGSNLAEAGRQADLIIGNNVYAHVPDINDFTNGLKSALKPNGTITLEFPHLMQLIEHVQFDTVYHEHFSYLSLYTVGRIFAQAGLRVFDVEEIPTHGGSLRVYGCHIGNARNTSNNVEIILNKEISHGLQEFSTYQSFQYRADQIKNDFLAFLIEEKRLGKKIAAYGAAAKGNTLLNYAGVKPDLLQFVCDAAPSKQGKFMPGSHIPILEPSMLRESKPDIVLILPWNIADEVISQHEYIRQWGGQFAVAVPSMRILQ